MTEQFQDRQLSAAQAFDEIQKLVAEQRKEQEERARLGMDAPTFGASTFQDFGGYESELLPDLDDAGGKVAAPDATQPDSDFVPFARYARLELVSPVVHCRMCGDASLSAPLCDQTTWNPSLPTPADR